MRKIYFIICICFMVVCNHALACTDFLLSAKDGSHLVTRTLEFAQDLKSNLRSSPRERVKQTQVPSGKPGLGWKAKYGYVYVDGAGQDAAMDGMNETGLSFEALYLPGYTQYQAMPPGKESQTLPYISLGDWVLGNFSTVDQVRAAIQKIYVVQAYLPGLGNTVFPLHFSVFDATGKGLVVEYVGGKLHLYDNDLGIFTNSPTFDWQMTNLKNYVSLSPWMPKPVLYGNLVFTATGQGSGMKGLPGDISPPSRFVKTSVMKVAVDQPVTAVDALNVAQHIIHNFDIPLGLVRAKVNGIVSEDYTQWIVYKDLTNKKFYYQTYRDTTLREIDFASLDFSKGAKHLKMPLTSEQYIFNMNDQFKQSVDTGESQSMYAMRSLG